MEKKEKNGIDVEQFEKNIKDAKAEDLVFIARYSKEKQKLQKTQVFISSTIATIAGSAVFASYIFPELDKVTVGIGAVVFGIATVLISFIQHKKDEKKLLSKMLHTASHPTSKDLEEAESYRREVLDIIEKEKQ
ncbi:hypothetical protein ACQKP8_26485 [Photobacterium alginatilyticum]|uniref:hypothetical protein n=1 Tax=Photobacterium alginatilyticum TaxID=1775171 RepID=UPI00406892B3